MCKGKGHDLLAQGNLFKQGLGAWGQVGLSQSLGRLGVWAQQFCLEILTLHPHGVKPAYTHDTIPKFTLACLPCRLLHAEQTALYFSTCGSTAVRGLIAQIWKLSGHIKCSFGIDHCQTSFKRRPFSMISKVQTTAEKNRCVVSYAGQGAIFTRCQKVDVPVSPYPRFTCCQKVHMPVKP